LRPDASLVLGSAEVSVLEMAGAYSTLANRGVRIDPQLILDVTTPSGAVLYRSQPTRTRVLDSSRADIVTYCLRQVVQKGTGTGAQIGRPVAGKTGTTEDYGDAWFVGYTPKLTAAVWMGWPEGASRKMTSVRGRRVNGGSFPATIWRRFMLAATKGTPVDSFVDPQSFAGRPVRGVRAVVPTSTTSTSSAPTTGRSNASTSSTTKPGGSSTTTAKPGPGTQPTTTVTPAATSTSTTVKPATTTTTAARPVTTASPPASGVP
jgi:penicillin-binding protein 1A